MHRTILRNLLPTLALCIVLSYPLISRAFCGFYVSQAGSEIYNKASKVVISRKDDKTVVTMASDFSGDAKEFAVVIPVPSIITKEQVNITENKIIDHLDAYSAPRLVEYFDQDPCAIYPKAVVLSSGASSRGAPNQKSDMVGLVKIEESYSVGEYNIILLSADDSSSLVKWLTLNGYKIPKGADKVLSSYIKQKMYFFLAKVNLAEYEAQGYKYLRPIQVAYESAKFMLPVRLGTVNASGDQELLIFTITSGGKVEPTNYRLIKMPTDQDLPQFTRKNFADVYKDIFKTQATREKKAIFLEYAWNVSWCDPCAADPLSAEELIELGAFWVDKKPRATTLFPNTKIAPMPIKNVFITRMHARYNRDTFPDDIIFHETGDQNNFQAKYNLRNPWTGDSKCEKLSPYLKTLDARREKEAQNLSNLTGRDIGKIREEIKKYNSEADANKLKWYQEMWGHGKKAD